MGVQIVKKHQYIPFFVGANFFDVYGREYKITHRNQYLIEIWNKPEMYDNYEYVFVNIENGKTHHCTQFDLEYKIETKKITFNDKLKKQLDINVEDLPEPKNGYWFVEVWHKKSEKIIKGFYYTDTQFNLKKALEFVNEKQESALIEVTEFVSYEEFKKHQEAKREFSKTLEYASN